MIRLTAVLVAATFCLVTQQMAVGQGTLLNTGNNAAGNNAAGNNTAGNISGQTGQSSNFTIQRDPNAFIGGAATNFIGGQGATTNAALSRLGGGGLLGGFGGFGRGNTGFGNQANTQANAEPQIRFRITLGFSHPRPSGTKLSAQFARRLTRIPQLPSAEFVSVTMEERTAVLAGEVETAREKRLIERLALMEPGVSAVRNELTVKAMPEFLPPAEATN